MQDSDEYPLEISILGFIPAPSCPEQEKTISISELETDHSSQELTVRKSSLSLILYKDDLHKIKDFEQPKPELLKEKYVLLGPKTKKYTLFLDLDHTLVYSEMVMNTSEKCDQYSLRTNLRKFAKELIQEMSELYEICIFTAASEEYAIEVVNKLDPDGKIKKIISRKHCVEIKEGFVVKDLRIFPDRDLKDMIIVDDSIYSFAFQIENGIPIKVFDGEEDDEELSLLIKYLRGLCEENSENISELNKNRLWIGK